MSDRHRTPRSSARRWGVLLAAPVLLVGYFLFVERPVEQPLRLALGTGYQRLNAVEIECLGPSGESIRSRWSPPQRAALDLNWQATDGEASCEVSLVAGDEIRRVVRRVALSGENTTLRLEHEVGKLNATPPMQRE